MNATTQDLFFSFLAPGQFLFHPSVARDISVDLMPVVMDNEELGYQEEQEEDSSYEEMQNEEETTDAYEETEETSNAYEEETQDPSYESEDATDAYEETEETYDEPTDAMEDPEDPCLGVTHVDNSPKEFVVILFRPEEEEGVMQVLPLFEVTVVEKFDTFW